MLKRLAFFQPSHENHSWIHSCFGMFSYTGALEHCYLHLCLEFLFEFMLAFVCMSLARDKLFQQGKGLVFIHIFTFHFSVVSLKPFRVKLFRVKVLGSYPLKIWRWAMSAVLSIFTAVGGR